MGASDGFVRFADRVLRVGVVMFAVGAMAMLASYCCGCAGPSRVVLAAHAGAGAAIHGADVIASSEVDRESHHAMSDALARGDTFEARMAIYDARMGAYLELDRTVRAAADAWLAADSIITAWQSSSSEADGRRWMHAAACALEAMLHIAAVARRLDIDLHMATALGALRAATPETCEAAQ